MPRRGAIVHVPAFAEEMNKSRRMVALQAKAWAEQGWLVLVPDLLGCGDSSGDAGDATWSDWLDDVRRAVHWAHTQAVGPLWLWGLRHGALLAAEAAASFGLDCGLLLWQPVVNGRQHLQQFFRLWTMGRVVGKERAEDDASPERLSQAGETVEVAGYRLSAALAQGMRAATLTATADVRQVVWLQLGPGEENGPSPAAERLGAAWKASSVPFSFLRVPTPSFWQSQEITVAEDLVATGCRLLAGEPAALDLASTQP